MHGYAGSSLVFLSFVHLISLLVWFVGVKNRSHFLSTIFLSYEACHYMYKIQGLCCWILSYYFIVVRETYQIYIMGL